MLDREIELIVPVELIEELTTAINEKPYLRTYIRTPDYDDLIMTLSETAEIVQPLSTIASLSRDPQVDYLLAHGLAEDVDYLVTGDKDLLSVGKIDQLCIITAAQFWSKLEIGLQ